MGKILAVTWLQGLLASPLAVTERFWGLKKKKKGLLTFKNDTLTYTIIK